MRIHFPLTLFSSLLILGLAASPSAGAALELRLPLGTDLWRVFTGHFVHFSPSHLLLDLAVWVPLSLRLESEGASRWWRLVLLAAVVVSAGVAWAETDLGRYRGLSGLDCALLGFWLVRLGAGGGARRVLASAIGLLVLAKAGLEALGGASLFAKGDFVSVPSAHVMGLAAGLVLALKWRPTPRIQALA